MYQFYTFIMHTVHNGADCCIGKVFRYAFSPIFPLGRKKATRPGAVYAILKYAQEWLDL